MLFNYDTV